MQTRRFPAILFCLLVLSIPFSSANLIEKACNLSDDKTTCITTLKSLPDTENATVPELAITILKLASENVANVTTHINTLLSTNSSNLEPTLYQRIDDCSVQFQDANDMVDNSMAAISVNAYDDVLMFLNVAIADADACEDGIKLVGSNKEVVLEVSKFDERFKRLCKIALAISKVAKAMN